MRSLRDGQVEEMVGAEDQRHESLLLEGMGANGGRWGFMVLCKIIWRHSNPSALKPLKRKMKNVSGGRPLGTEHTVLLERQTFLLGSGLLRRDDMTCVPSPTSLTSRLSALAVLTFWAGWFFVVGDSPVHYRMFSSLPTLYPRDASSSPTRLSLDIEICPQGWEWGAVTQVENHCLTSNVMPSSSGCPSITSLGCMSLSPFLPPQCGPSSLCCILCEVYFVSLYSFT